MSNLISAVNDTVMNLVQTDSCVLHCYCRCYCFDVRGGVDPESEFGKKFIAFYELHDAAKVDSAKATLVCGCRVRAAAFCC